MNDYVKLVKKYQDLLEYLWPRLSSFDQLYISEIKFVTDTLVKYPNIDPQFPKRRWTNDWSNFIDIDFNKMDTFYTVPPVQPMIKGDPDYIMLSKEQIACQLELIGVKFRGHWYSVDKNLFPGEYIQELEEITELKSLDKMTEYFNNLAVKHYQVFLEEQNRIKNDKRTIEKI